MYAHGCWSSGYFGGAVCELGFRFVKVASFRFVGG